MNSAGERQQSVFFERRMLFTILVKGSNWLTLHQKRAVRQEEELPPRSIPFQIKIPAAQKMKETISES